MASALGSGGGGMAPSDGAKHWTSTIIQALQMAGAPSNWLGGMLSLITRESGGNPNAINRTDINAQHGDPSRGLTQTIGATFNAYKMPGHNNIYDPLDNILASIRYIKARYGSVYNGPAQSAYDNGGYIPPHSFAYNGGSVPELALNGAQGDALRKKIEGIGSGGNIIKVYVDGVEVAQRRVTIEEIDKNNHALYEHITKL
jgi:transglycosylase-like protein with SLT domain